MGQTSTHKKSNKKRVMAMNMSPAVLQQAILLVGKANTLIQAKSHTQAVQAFQQAIRICPTYSVAYQNFINMLIDLDEFENALKVVKAIPTSIYQQSAILRERHAIVLSNLGKCEEALAIFNALLDAPEIDKSRLHSNIAACHSSFGDEEKALAELKKATALKSGSVLLYLNLTSLLLKLNDIEGARTSFQDALQLHPENPEIIHDYAYFLLCDEDYENGFRLYKKRAESERCPASQYEVKITPWDEKKPLASLLILREQGVGDEILLSSFYPRMKDFSKRLTVVCDNRLHPLFKRSYPDIHFIRHDDAPGIPASDHDFFIHAGDCGYHARDSLGWKKGYLKPDTLRSTAIREKYQQLFPGKKLVGISWKSTREGMLGEQRAAALSLWRLILENPACQFINLQYGDIADDLRHMRENLGVNIHEDADIDCFNDLDGLAAQMAALDLIITTTNTTAHLAAAIDAPTWITTPVGIGTFWCWGFREKTPFYPKARLFRAQKFKEWEPVFLALRESLGQFTQE